MPSKTLDGQREHVIGILEGLSEQDLRRLVLPTGWNCLELAVRGRDISTGKQKMHTGRRSVREDAIPLFRRSSRE